MTEFRYDKIQKNGDNMTQIIQSAKGSSGQVEKQQDTLLSYDDPTNEAVALAVQDLKRRISGSTLIDGYTIPTYGVLSLKMINTPIYAYDHPRLMKMCNTGFTDGVHIFVSSPFMKKLMEEEDAADGMELGGLPFVLHELMHMLKNHVRRLKAFPKDIANAAEDLSINSQLQLGFPAIKWVPSLREVGMAFNSTDAERYASLAEETIAKELMEKRKQQQDKNKQQQNQQQQGKGQGQGKPQQGSGQPQQGDGEQDEWEDNHTVPLEDLIDALNEAGLNNVLEALELPQDAGDVEAIGKIEETVKLRDVEAVQKAAAQKAQLGDGKYPGSHIVDSCAEVIKGFTEGKLVWKLGLKQFLFGDGMRFRYSDVEPGALYYVDPKDMSLDSEVYIGADLPHKPEEVVLCLIDTSGSVSNEMLKSFLSEIFSLKRENYGLGDSASEIVVVFADTVVRGGIEINESNMDELLAKGVGAAGRGGTDLGNDLRQTMALPVFKEKKIASVVFFTDLCDQAPKKSDFPANIPLCFITTPDMRSEEFAKAVKEFARVYVIEEGVEIDLTDEHLSQSVNTKRHKR